MTHADVVAEARTWVGVPWRHQGWRRTTGCDCVGLVRGVGTALGLFDGSDANPALSPFLGYPREPNPEVMRRALALYLTPLEGVAAAEPGDVLWLRFERQPRHLAILTEPAPGSKSPGVIHALESVGRAAEHRLDYRWAARCRFAWRFNGLA